MRILLALIVTMGFLTSCKPKVSSPREPASQGATGSVKRYWSDLPILINVANEFDQDFPPLTTGQLNPFEEMMLEWDNQVNVTLFDIDSHRTPNFENPDLRAYSDTEIGIYRIEDWYDNVTSDALAIAQFFFIRTNVGTSSEFNRIVHADIMVNYQTHQFYLDHTADKVGKYDLKTVVLHELGHLIGIDHLSGTAVMNAFLSTGEQKRFPLLNDINAVRNLYQPQAPALTLSKLTTSQSSAPHPDEGKRGRGIIELLKSGECNHYEDGELVHSHKIDPSALK